jgi:hypothetical protein
MRKRSLAAFGAAVVAASGVTLAAATADFTPPTGYRHWFHVNSQLVDSTSPSFAQLGGLHNVYVNAIGQPALESNAPYPDGSVFADDVHKFTVSSGTYTEGARAALVVMKKDGKLYAATGGWGFQAWAGGDPAKPLVTDPVAQCFNCHTSQTDHQYVFSTYIP